jgi:hypothetical protein
LVAHDDGQRVSACQLVTVRLAGRVRLFSGDPAGRRASLSPSNTLGLRVEPASVALRAIPASSSARASEGM